MKSETPLWPGRQGPACNQATSRTARWIDGALASPIGRSGGQFSQFSGREPTKVPAFVMHSRTSLNAVGGWDESFITSQDSELSMRLLKSDTCFTGMAPPRFTCTSAQPLQLVENGHRYGFWRTKVLLKHLAGTWQEFLPLVGLLLTMALGVARTPLVGPCCMLWGRSRICRCSPGDAWRWLVGSCWRTPVFADASHQFYAGYGRWTGSSGRLPSDRS